MLFKGNPYQLPPKSLQELRTYYSDTVATHYAICGNTTKLVVKSLNNNSGKYELCLVDLPTQLPRDITLSEFLSTPKRLNINPGTYIDGHHHHSVSFTDVTSGYLAIDEVRDSSPDFDFSDLNTSLLQPNLKTTSGVSFSDYSVPIVSEPNSLNQLITK